MVNQLCESQDANRIHLFVDCYAKHIGRLGASEVLWLHVQKWGAQFLHNQSIAEQSVTVRAGQENRRSERGRSASKSHISAAITTLLCKYVVRAKGVEHLPVCIRCCTDAGVAMSTVPDFSPAEARPAALLRWTLQFSGPVFLLPSPRQDDGGTGGSHSAPPHCSCSVQNAQEAQKAVVQAGSVS